MGLFMLPGVVFALPGGLLGQRFGSLRVVFAGLGLMIAGGMLVAYAVGFGSAALGRTLAGIGGVLVNIMLARMVADWFRGRELQTALGLMLAAWPFGMALALMMLGPLALLASWRVAEYATVVVGRPRAGGHGAPLPGSARGAGDDARGCGSTCRARVWILAISAGVGWALLNASIIVVASFAPSFLMARGASVGEAGLITGAALWISIVSVPLGGLVADRVNRPKLLIVTGCLAAAIGMVAIACAPMPGAVDGGDRHPARPAAQHHDGAPAPRGPRRAPGHRVRRVLRALLSRHGRLADAGRAGCAISPAIPRCPYCSRRR